MLSEEQETELRKQLINQIRENFPKEKQQNAISNIEEMNSKEFEEFIQKNKLIKNLDENENTEEISKTPQCIFCSIVSGEISSYKVDENKEAIAVLEINPVSKGHVLIIPKKHVSSITKINKEILSLAKKLSIKIKSKLKPKDIILSNSKLFEHEIINVIPVYKEENLHSKRYKEDEKIIQEIKNILEEKERPKKIKVKEKVKQISNENLWLPKRIP